MHEASSAPGRKTVLIVEDDPGTRRVLASGLATTLGMFEVLTAEHGQEAMDVLDRQPVDVVVTDLAMPIMDGFALIGALSNRASAPPVVVLSALAPTTVAEGLDGYSGLTVLRKPAGYPEVARAVLDALERHALGQVAGIPLASVLQLVEAERRSCTLAVASGRRRGRLYFESGRLINAFSEDFGADGEAAAYDILSWDRTAIEFERLPDAVRRTIQQSTQALLIEVARRQDALRATPVPASVAPLAASAAADGGEGARAEEVATGPAPDAAMPDAAMPDAAMPEDAAPEATAPHDTAPGTIAPDGAAPAAHAASLEPVFGDAARRGPTDDGAVPADDLPPDLRGAGATAGAASVPDVPDLFAADREPAPAEAPHPPAPEAAPHGDASDADARGEPRSVDLEVPDAGAPDLTSGPDDGAPAAVQPPAEPPVPTAAPVAGDASAVPAPTAAATTPPHAALVEAIERLTRRVLEADAALEAVSEEVLAFREAQRRYDEAAEHEARRRRAVAEAHRDVARLAHEILERMDGLFALERGGALEAGGPAAGAAPRP